METVMQKRLLRIFASLADVRERHTRPGCRWLMILANSRQVQVDPVFP
jgi:hypothetical protein